MATRWRQVVAVCAWAQEKPVQPSLEFGAAHNHRYITAVLVHVVVSVPTQPDAFKYGNARGTHRRFASNIKRTLVSTLLRHPCFERLSH